MAGASSSYRPLDNKDGSGRRNILLTNRQPTTPIHFLDPYRLYNGSRCGFGVTRLNQTMQFTRPSRFVTRRFSQDHA
eukprot:30339-Eustigmatos_ZCMA.PRE.1